MTKIEAYEDLKQKIIKRQFTPGQWLVERDLSDTYGISRTPVREVLFRLVSDGFLLHERSRGFSIRTLTLEQVIELFQAREAVEGYATRLACERITSPGKIFLKELRAKIAAVDVAKDAPMGVEYGRMLHAFIRDTARNELMADFYTKLNNLSAMAVNLTSRVPKIEGISQKSHLEIIDAVLSGDPDRAQQAMCDHLRDTARLISHEFFAGTLAGV